MFTSLIEYHYGEDKAVVVLSEGTNAITITLRHDEPIRIIWPHHDAASSFARTAVLPVKREPETDVCTSLLSVLRFIQKHGSAFNLDRLTKILAEFFAMGDEKRYRAEPEEEHEEQKEIFTKAAIKQPVRDDGELSDADINFLLLSGY